MRIMIKAGKFQYDLNLDNRITIIQGNSGTGKTTLANLIDEMNFAPKSYVKVYPKVQIRRFVKSDLESKNYDKNIIFIIDEGTFERSKEFARIVNTVENKFIIITRDSLPTIHYSSDSVNTLEMDGNNVYRLEKRFKENETSWGL